MQRAAVRETESDGSRRENGPGFRGISGICSPRCSAAPTRWSN